MYNYNNVEMTRKKSMRKKSTINNKVNSHRVLKTPGMS